MQSLAAVGTGWAGTNGVGSIPPGRDGEWLCQGRAEDLLQTHSLELIVRQST